MTNVIENKSGLTLYVIAFISIFSDLENCFEADDKPTKIKSHISCVLTSMYYFIYLFLLQQLETELRKLQSIIQDSMTGFDDMLNVVFMKKIKVMMVVYQVSISRCFI